MIFDLNLCKLQIQMLRLPLKMDDWTIKVPPPEKVIVPSFIRLFVIARILKHCNASVDQIKQMVKVIKDLKQQQTAQDILIRLINDGIKKYMEKWFNEKEQIQVIEMMFNTIILKQFEKEYQTIMRCDDNNKSQYYQRLVLNADDLMCLIFQFIKLKETFTGDLINCGLVNSYWLYQTWNPNTIYYLCLNRLITNTIRMTRNLKESNDKGSKVYDLDRILSSKWQRVATVKSVHIGLYNSVPSQYLLEKISMLRSIVDVSLIISDTYVSLLKALLYYNKENIKEYWVVIRGVKQQNKLKPLELINAKDILVKHMYYYLKWSHRCKILRLVDLPDINENWIKYVIDNCDCNGIQTLIIDNISVNSLLNPETKSTQLLFNKLAQKFQNLQRLSLKMNQDKAKKSMFLVSLKCLRPIIKKTSTVMTLKLHSGFAECDKLAKIIQDTGIKMSHLKICEFDHAIDDFKPIIFNSPNLESLTIDKSYLGRKCCEKKLLDLLLAMECTYTDNSKASGKKLEEKSSDGELTHGHGIKSGFSSLKMIDINDKDFNTSINTISQILGLKLIKKNKLYLKMVFKINVPRSNSSVFRESFKTMCKTIKSLLISEQVPIEVSITMDGMEQYHFENIYYPIFEQHLSQYARKNWKVPIVNEYCEVLSEPVFSLKFDEYYRYGDADDAAPGEGRMSFEVYNVYMSN